MSVYVTITREGRSAVVRETEHRECRRRIPIRRAHVRSLHGAQQGPSAFNFSPRRSTKVCIEPMALSQALGPCVERYFDAHNFRRSIPLRPMQARLSGRDWQDRWGVHPDGPFLECRCDLITPVRFSGPRRPRATAGTVAPLIKFPNRLRAVVLPVWPIRRGHQTRTPPAAPTTPNACTSGRARAFARFQGR